MTVELSQNVIEQAAATESKKAQGPPDLVEVSVKIPQKYLNAAMEIAEYYQEPFGPWFSQVVRIALDTEIDTVESVTMSKYLKNKHGLKKEAGQ